MKVTVGLLSAIALASCARTHPKPVSIAFEDFPQNVATIDLGQSLTVDATISNDDGAGVTWNCTGEACGAMKATPASLTFKASRITGTAVLIATSRKEPAVSKNLKITVLLNESPDQTCK